MGTDDLLNLERDIIQSRLVSAVFARSLKNQIVLKGGVAMRVLLGSARYTKDVDFGQSAGQSLTALQKLIRASIKECTSGFLGEAIVTEPKQTDTVARWKISGTSLRSRSIIHLTVEVSRRGLPLLHLSQSRFMPAPESFAKPAVVDVYDIDAMAATKVFALHSDSRMAPRDLFDLDLIIKTGVQPDPSLFSCIEDRKEFVNQVWRKIDLMSWKMFEEDVVPYMTPAFRSRVDEGVFDDMKIKVGEAVEKWVTAEDDGGGSSSSANKPRMGP
jgi:predicted nucleotidyltransferase component of viral defense system